jgi:hypothetical protein
VDALLMLVIAFWVVINAYVTYKGFVFLRLQGKHAPDATNEDMARWVRGKEPADDLPEAMQPALKDLRAWRAVGRKYFLFSVVAILALVVLRQAGIA